MGSLGEGGAVMMKVAPPEISPPLIILIRRLDVTCADLLPPPSLLFPSSAAPFWPPPSRSTEISKPRRPPLFYHNHNQSRLHTLTHTFSPFITSYSSYWGPGWLPWDQLLTPSLFIHSVWLLACSLVSLERGPCHAGPSSRLSSLIPSSPPARPIFPSPQH
jgi:hypothetical protein